jgi:SAM-dependent methyltransferase
MADSYARWAEPPPESYYPLIRELMAYDALCPVSNPLAREPDGRVRQFLPPAPLHWSRQTEWPWSIAEGEIEPVNYCMDIGSGWSVNKFAVAKRCKALTCIEPNAEFIAKATPGLDIIGDAFGINGILTLTEDARDMAYRSKAFDRVFFMSVLEHIPDRRDVALSEACRVLKPGGLLMLSMDVRLIGSGDGSDFHVGRDEAASLLGQLGLAMPDETPRMLTGAFPDKRVQKLGVLLVKWRKP